MKFGALPTKNLPQKSHPTKTPAPRKQIVKYEVPVKLKKTIQISSTMDIVQQFDKLAKSNWRMESDEKKQALHFLYYINFMHQHIPDVSLFITQEENKLIFDAAFCGRAAPHFSNSLKFADNSNALCSFLEFIQKQLPCKGYNYVHDNSTWIQIPFCDASSNKNTSLRQA